MSDQKQTVSLVLGSGGARGLAHIGVIKWIEENGFVIQSIAGSSMGALIGGIYATGKLDVYENWVRALERVDIIRLLDFSFTLSGLFKGERIIDVLKKLIGDVNIEDLPITFTAVASDLDAEREVWINKGSLFDAIRASIAIPTVFTPHKINGRRLLDGGLMNPIPIAPTMQDMTDLTIAVNLSARAEAKYDKGKVGAEHHNTKSKYRRAIDEFIDSVQERFRDVEEPEEAGFFDIVSQSFDALQNSIARLKLAAYSPDVVIDVPKNICSIYEFDRASELISIGYERARDTMSQYKKRNSKAGRKN